MRAREGYPYRRINRVTRGEVCEAIGTLKRGDFSRCWIIGGRANSPREGVFRLFRGLLNVHLRLIRHKLHDHGWDL